MIRIVIADDHNIVRAGLRSFLEGEEDLEVVGEAGTGREAVDLCKREKCDVILLDLDMPDIDGLEAIEKIIALRNGTKILVLTMHDNEDYVIHALKKGASGFMLKASSPEKLPVAIRKVASGERHITRSLMEKITLRQCNIEGKDPLSRLSERELQILPKLAAGVTLKEIARELNMGISTVATHKKKLMKKLELKNRSDLVAFSLKQGLLDNSH